MMKELKAFWDKYCVAIICGTLATVIGGIILAIDHLWDYTKNIYSEIYSYLFGSVYVPRYSVGIFMALVFGNIVCMCVKLFKSRKIEPWEKITELGTGNVKWRWTNLYMEEPVNIRPFCAACGFELIYMQTYVPNTYEDATNMFCERCGKTMEAFPCRERDILIRIKKLIQDSHRKSMGQH